jgi:two-component system sensor histidine kinase MprB
VSFRRRLTLLTAGAVALAVAAAAAASYFLVRGELLGQIDDSLRERAGAARGFVGGAPFGPGGGPPGPGLEAPGSRPTENAIQLPERIGGPERVGQVVDAQGNVVVSIGLDGARLPVEPAVELLAGGGRGEVLTDTTVDGEHLRVLTVRLPPGDEALQLARSLEETDSTLDTLALILLVVAIGGVAIAAGSGLLIARAALAPAARLTETAEEVARTEEIEGDDELARLGASFNEMLAALERSVGAQKRLVSDASHELRTPLTSLRTNIETLARRPEMPESDRQRLLSDLSGELEELGRLVDDIVDLAREGTDGSAADGDVRLDELVAAAVSRARRRAPGREITTTLERSVVHGDPERLDRAISNLLDNAVKWTPEGGSIEVGLEGGRLTVDDGGPGIPAPDLPHVFDRFYRAANARGTAGSGLGLAITKQVAESHHGAVRAENRPGGGSRFELTLPLEAPPPSGPEHD